MGLISRFFGKSTDFLGKGDALFESRRFYEARTMYEEGLRSYQGKAGSEEMAALLGEKIDLVNREMASLNLVEAGHAMKRGFPEKAVEHLELALTLTEDKDIHDECERMLSLCTSDSIPGYARGQESLTTTSCQSCPGTANEEDTTDTHALSTADHYELLIRQLPQEMYNRYSLMDDVFIASYVLAGNDQHEDALKMLESWYKGNDEDIYWHEKGTLLHRLGDVPRAEDSFRRAQARNPANPLPCLSLATLFCHEHRYEEAANQLDAIITAGMIVEQAQLMRGEVSEISGDLEDAMERYGTLLRTSAMHPAAERLYSLLNRTGRAREAAELKKTYLGGCRH